MVDGVPSFRNKPNNQEIDAIKQDRKQIETTEKDNNDEIKNEKNEDVIVEAPRSEAIILETAQDLIASKDEPTVFSHKSNLENEKIESEKSINKS